MLHVLMSQTHSHNVTTGWLGTDIEAEINDIILCHFSLFSFLTFITIFIILFFDSYHVLKF